MPPTKRDPAQLDRFIKIKVREDANEWAEFAIETIIECDAEIQQVYKVRSAKDISYNIHGHGGTSFIPVIEFVNSSRYFRDAILIYFTDGYGDPSIPRPLTRRTMWVLHNDQCALSVHNPYGVVFVMD